jgi:tight adherence protein B
MLIISVLAFFVVIFLLATITVAIAWMAFAKKTVETEAARDMFAGSEAGWDEPVAAGDQAGVNDEESNLFRDQRLSTLSFWDNLLARFDFVDILRSRIGEAELTWSVGRVTLAMLLCGTITTAILTKLLPTWAALAGGAAVAFAPYAVILQIREKRFRKFREAFPDVLDSLARALKAGYPLAAAMEMVAMEAQAPISTEIKRTAAEANLGMGWPRALENLGKRVPLLEVNLFSSAVALHARTGGKLSEVMVGLAENMREALALQGEVRALAAHGKLTGLILTILPIGIATMMFFVSPQYMSVLLEHPYGKNLIAAAVICLVLAHFVIRKLVDIKI